MSYLRCDNGIWTCNKERIDKKEPIQRLFLYQKIIEDRYIHAGEFSYR